MTQREIDEIELKRVIYETERIEDISTATVNVVFDSKDLYFHATTYARNMLVAKILVCEQNEDIQYITLYGEKITISKINGKKILKAIVVKQDTIWEEYFNRVRSLYVTT